MGKVQTHVITAAVLAMMRGDDAREHMLHRLHVVALVLGGVSAKDAATIFDDSPRAIAYWVKRFTAHGVAGLEAKRQPGRPSRLDASQLKQLHGFIAARRKKGEPVTGQVVAAHIKDVFGVVLTVRQCWRIVGKVA